MRKVNKIVSLVLFFPLMFSFSNAAYAIDTLALKSALERKEMEMLKSDLAFGRILAADRAIAASPAYRTVAQVLAADKFDYNIKVDSKEISLRDYFTQLDKKYQAAIEEMANAAITAKDVKEIKDTLTTAENSRMDVVKKYYNIGKEALDLDGNSKEEYKKNYAVALYAFNKVRRMRPLTKQEYLESVLGSAYTPPEELLPDLPEADEYIKDVDQRWNDALKRYLSDVSLPEAAVENILYDLRISDEELFWGDTVNGRMFNQLSETALALRTMLLEKGVTHAMKARAAAFLASLFTTYFYNGMAAKAIDQGGGLSVPEEVYDLVINGKNIEDFEKAEALAFTTFMLNPDFDTLHGHSLTAMAWLSDIYQRLSKYHHSKSIEDALDLEMQKYRPQLAESLNGLAKKERYNNILDTYKQSFPEVRDEFKSGGGVEVELPVRGEWSPGGIGDFAWNAATNPDGYSILNSPIALTRVDGTVGRNIKVGVEIRDLDEMPRNEKHERAFITVRSLDMGFRIDVFNAGDILKETKASLVLDTLVSKGIFPKPLLEKAVRENKEVEVVEDILRHILGEDKGLAIDLHVENIAPGSGLAISNMLAMGVSLAFARLMKPTTAKEPGKTTRDIEDVNVATLPLQISADEPKTEDGFYEIQVSKDFNNEEEQVFTYTTRAGDDNELKVDIPVDEIGGAGRYYVRKRYLTSQQILDNKLNGQWSDISEITINPSQTQEWEYYDSKEDVYPAIIDSQNTQHSLDNFAGTQDDVSAMNGRLKWVHGSGRLEGRTSDGRKVEFPGGVIPTVTEVHLTDDATKNLNSRIKIVRVGITEDAELTLQQVHNSHILYKGEIEANAWAQVTVEMLKAAVLGDTVSMGRLAVMSVPLREKIAPISIDPMVADAMKEIIYKYGAQGVSVGITGARSGGSIEFFFPPEMSESRVQEILDDSISMLKKSIKARGKLRPIEDEPKLYAGLQLLRRGARIRVLEKNEMLARRNLEIEPMTVKELALHGRKQKNHMLFSREEVEKLVKDYRAVGDDETPALKEKDLLILDPLFSASLKRVLNNKEVISIKKVQELAIKNLEEKYEKFNAPGANPHLRELLRGHLVKNAELIAKLKPEQQRALYIAIQKGEIDPMLDYNQSQLEQLSNKESSLKDVMPNYDEKRNRFEDELKAAKKEYGPVEKDGIALVPEKFYKEIEKEKTRLKSIIENGDGTTWDKLLLDVLTLAPDPEGLPYNHFLFNKIYGSSTYKKFFGKKMEALEEGINNGALVYVPLAGGMGTRFTGGNAVKPALAWHYGDEPDASYLSLFLRKWAKFLEKFPARKNTKQRFILVVLGAFVKDAILKVLKESAKKAGLGSGDEIAETPGDLRRVVLPTKDELELDRAIQSAVTPQQNEQIKRKYEKWIENSNEQLRKVNENKSQGDAYIRAPFTQSGLNKMGEYAGVGTTKDVADMISENLPQLSAANLKKMGYELDEKLLEKVPELEKKGGMPLAKAALVVKGKGLKVAMIQNGSSIAPINHLATGDAMEQILNNEQPQNGPIAIAQYVNGAGGLDVGGILVKEKSSGAIISLEGNRLKFAEKAVLEDDYTAFATGTVYLNLVRLYQLVGYEDIDRYLRTEKQEREQRISSYIANIWPQTYVLRTRTEEEVGRSEVWPILQAEAPLSFLLGWIQKQNNFGKNPVLYQETKARYTLNDHKTVRAQEEALTRAQSFWGAGLRTPLPPKVSPNVDVAGEDRERWEEVYSEFLKAPEERLFADADINELRKNFLDIFRKYNSRDFNIHDADKYKKRMQALAGLIATTNALLGATNKGTDKDKEKELKFIKSELEGLFDLTAEPYLRNEKKIQGFRVYPHKVTALVDKDNTMASAVEELSPEQARQLIRASLRGQTTYILTGASALEAWTNVFEPVIAVIDTMGLTRTEKVVALERIRIMANDGTSIVKVDTTDNEFKVAELVHNDVFKDGKWQPPKTLEVVQNGKEDKSNRLKVWNASVKAYLRRLFEEKLPQDRLFKFTRDEFSTFKDQDDEQLKSSLAQFIGSLALKLEDIEDMEQMGPERFKNVYKPISWALKKMLQNSNNTGWKPVFDEVFNKEYLVRYKLFGEDPNGDYTNDNNKERKKADLTLDEEIMAAFLTIHFKEAHWTFGSISGDVLDKGRQTDSRLRPLGDAVINKGFWDKVTGYADKALQKAQLTAQDGEPVPFKARAGPGYYNVSFGGASKINFAYGMLHDPKTLGHIIYFMGDSITDQGEFPHVSKAKVARNIVNSIPNDQLKKFNKLTILTIENNSLLKWEGPMSETEKDELKKLSKDEDWLKAVDKLYGLAYEAHEERLVLRVLLGGLLEKDAVERQKLRDAGLLRTKWHKTKVDPMGDGYGLLRWGPSAFYDLVDAILTVAEGKRIFSLNEPRGMWDVRDRYVRGMIERLNKRKVSGFSLIVPTTLNKITSDESAKLDIDLSHLSELLNENNRLQKEVTGNAAKMWDELKEYVYNPKEKARDGIGLGYLYWLTDDEKGTPTGFDVMEKDAERYRSMGIDTVVYSGEGGQILGNRALIEALGSKTGIEFIFATNLQSRTELKERLKGKGKKVLFIGSSKSGGTDETAFNIQTMIRYFIREFADSEKEGDNLIGKLQGKDWTNDNLGLDEKETKILQEVSRHLLFTTTESEKSALYRLSVNIRNQTSGKAEVKTYPIPLSIGGRFSVLSESGNITSFLAGLDVRAMNNVIRRLKPVFSSHDPEANPALKAAIMLNSVMEAKGSSRKILVGITNYGKIHSVLEWMGQLVMESLGKEGVGPYFMTAEGKEAAEELASKEDDGSIYYIINVLKHNNRDLEPITVEDLDGKPAIVYNIKELNEESLAAFFLFNEELAVRYGLLNAARAGIKSVYEGTREKEIYRYYDPQDQLAVEAAKKKTVPPAANRLKAETIDERKYEMQTAYNNSPAFVKDGTTPEGFLMENASDADNEDVNRLLKDAVERTGISGASDDRLKEVVFEIERLFKKRISENSPERLIELNGKIESLYEEIAEFGKGRQRDNIEEIARSGAKLLYIADKLSGRQITNLFLYSPIGQVDVFGEWWKMLGRKAKKGMLYDYMMGTREQHSRQQGLIDGPPLAITVFVKFIEKAERIFGEEEKDERISKNGMAKPHMDGLYPQEMLDVYFKGVSDAFAGHNYPSSKEKSPRDIIKIQHPSIRYKENLPKLYRLFGRMNELYREMLVSERLASETMTTEKYMAEATSVPDSILGLDPNVASLRQFLYESTSLDDGEKIGIIMDASYITEYLGMRELLEKLADKTIRLDSGTNIPKFSILVQAKDDVERRIVERMHLPLVEVATNQPTNLLLTAFARKGISLDHIGIVAKPFEGSEEPFMEYVKKLKDIADSRGYRIAIPRKEFEGQTISVHNVILTLLDMIAGGAARQSVSIIEPIIMPGAAFKEKLEEHRQSISTVRSTI